MIFDEFKNKIYLGWFNCGTHVNVTLFYVNRENPNENKERQIQLGLNPPVNRYLTLNIDIKTLFENCIPAIKVWYDELNLNKVIEEEKEEIKTDE